MEIGRWSDLDWKEDVAAVPNQTDWRKLDSPLCPGINILGIQLQLTLERSAGTILYAVHTEISSCSKNIQYCNSTTKISVLT